MPPHVEKIEVTPFVELDSEVRLQLIQDTQSSLDRINHLAKVGLWVELDLDVKVNLKVPAKNHGDEVA